MLLNTRGNPCFVVFLCVWGLATKSTSWGSAQQNRRVGVCATKVGYFRERKDLATKNINLSGKINSVRKNHRSRSSQEGDYSYVAKTGICGWSDRRTSSGA